ncbi:MAG: NosD domain-containing protein [Candidatus Thermoplasmatota archaeon]
MNRIKAIIVCATFFAELLILLPMPTIAITLHSPIYIDGKADFASKASKEGWVGNGSIGAPYIIENYDISAITAHGIDIRNTKVYFIIRNCIIHDGISNKKDGIHLYNVTNGKIQNLGCYNNYNSIYLMYSSNNSISRNEIYNNSEGVNLYFSSNNNITSNQIYGNSKDGIHLTASTYNNISENKIHNNSWDGICFHLSSKNEIISNWIYRNSEGVYLDSSSNNILKNNILENNTHNFGVDGPAIYSFYQEIDVSNKINGKPIYYIAKQNNLLFDESIAIGYLGLISCKNITVKNLTINDNLQGLLLVDNSYSTIILNQIYKNHYGIYLFYSSFNNISANNIYNNFDGIYLSYSSNNNITSNQIYNNNEGIRFSYSLNNKIHYNGIYNNTNYGIYNSNKEPHCIENATHNWWGSACGPSGNGTGKGDRVSSNVLYKPWLIEPFAPQTIVKTSRKEEKPLLLIITIVIILIAVSVIITRKLRKK